MSLMSMCFFSLHPPRLTEACHVLKAVFRCHNTAHSQTLLTCPTFSTGFCQVCLGKPRQIRSFQRWGREIGVFTCLFNVSMSRVESSIVM